MSLKPVAILGAGSFGTALALYLARRGQTVRIWSIDPTEITAILTDKANNRYLPGYPLPALIVPHHDLRDTLDGIDDVIIAVPSIGFRNTLTLIQPLLSNTARIISVSKGIDAASGRLLNELVEDVLGKAYPFAALAGPSFAKEVAEGLPTAVMAASTHQTLLTDVVVRFNSPLFRVYPCNDVIGVEVGSVVKNVIAIAAGICDGMELGANARSALLTLGLAEIIRLGQTLGGKLETMIGLAGMGDLILTCSDNQSRNRRFGLALGRGLDLLQAEKEIGQAIEGKRNAELVVNLASRHKVVMPISETVWDILQGKLKVKPADEMLARMFR